MSATSLDCRAVRGEGARPPAERMLPPAPTIGELRRYAGASPSRRTAEVVAVE